MKLALNAAFADVRTGPLQQLGQELVEEVLVNAPPEERARILPPKRGWR